MEFLGRTRGIVAGNVSVLALIAIGGFLVAAVAIPRYLTTPASPSTGDASAAAGATSQSVLQTTGAFQVAPTETPPPTQTVEAAESAAQSSGPTPPVAVTKPPARPVASVPAPTSTPAAVIPTAGPTATPCVFGIGDAGVAVGTPRSATPGGTGWLFVGHANCPTAHVDALQVTFPNGETTTEGAPAVLGVDLKWTFPIPANAGVGQAVLRLPGSGVDIDGVAHSGVLVMYIQIVAP